MEPVGLAVGLVGLAGLFSTCLDAVDRFDSWRNFADDSRLLQTLVEGQKLRLKRWGHAVGLDHGVVAEKHHSALDDPKMLASIRGNLLEIRNICSNVDATLPNTFENHGPAQPRVNLPLESRRVKLKWALRDKTKVTEKVQMFSTLVQNLHDLVPLVDARAEENSLLSDSWALQLQEVLSTLDATKVKDIRAWLLGTYIPIGRYETAVQARLDGTFDWFLERQFFLNWSSGDFPNRKAKVLWVNGPPGFGKTVLCARIVQHLSNTTDSPLAYFFFSSDDSESRRDPFLAIRSWLTQLLSYSSALEVVRKESESESQTSLIASRAHVVAMLKTIVQNIPGCTFILDGIDECIGVGSAYDMEDRSVTTFLESVQQAIANTTTRLLIVSRTIAEVRQSFIHNSGMTYFDYTLSCDDNQADIKLYATDIVDKKLRNKDATIKGHISTKLAESCNGQFLWIKLQGPSLRSGKNRKQLEAVIDRTPAELDQLYDRDWQRLRNLPTDECTRAVSLLRWAAFALRPLTVAEITEALLITDDGDILVDEMPDSIDQDYVDGEILGLCGSLIEIRDATSDSNVDSMTVHLAHFSVKEFFISRISADEGTLIDQERFCNSIEVTQNSILAISCLRYLKIRGIWQDDDEQSCHIPRQFLNYAAELWQEHAAESRSSDNEAIRLTNEFLSEKNKAWTSWRKWYYDTNPDDDRGIIVANTPLHFAALFGLTATVQFLIETKNCNIDERTTWGDTALHISCIIGDIETAAALRAAGANIATANKYEETPLSVACKEGHFKDTLL